MTHSPQFTALCESIRNEIKEIDITDLNKALSNQDDLVLIDVREFQEWSENQIPSAIFLSKGVIERDIEQRVPNPNQKCVLYCGGGYRSALACFNLQKMGYNAVFSLKGGFKAWQTAGYPIVIKK